MKSGLSALLGLMVLGAAASASANTITLTFKGPTGGTGGTDDGSANGLLNTLVTANSGADGNAFRFSRTDGDSCTTVLFRVPLPADFAGATVNSATFTIGPWYSGVTARTFDNVQARRITVDWVQGTGTWANRWVADSGATRNFSNYNPTTPANSVDWAGNVGASSSANITTALDSTAFDTQTVVTTADNTFNLQSLLQGWASGTWSNKGFAITAANGTSTDGLGEMRVTGGLVINYTPVPEPAVAGVLATGSLVMLRRRRRTA